MAQVVVVRAELDDWYVDGGESAVLVDDRVVVLSELATAIVELTAGSGLPLPELAAALAERFGVPPDSSPMTATAAAVHELVTAGAVRTQVS